MSQSEICFLNKKLSKSTEFYYLEPGLHDFITDVVEALIEERHNHSQSCFTVKVSRRRKKFKIYLANEEYNLAFLLQTWDTFSVAMLAMNLE